MSDGLSTFAAAVQELGFKSTRRDVTNPVFVLLYFAKPGHARHPPLRPGGGEVGGTGSPPVAGHDGGLEASRPHKRSRKHDATDVAGSTTHVASLHTALPAAASADAGAGTPPAAAPLLSKSARRRAHRKARLADTAAAHNGSPRDGVGRDTSVTAIVLHTPTAATAPTGSSPPAGASVDAGPPRSLSRKHATAAAVAAGAGGVGGAGVGSSKHAPKPALSAAALASGGLKPCLYKRR